MLKLVWRSWSLVWSIKYIFDFDIVALKLGLLITRPYRV